LLTLNWRISTSARPTPRLAMFWLNCWSSIDVYILVCWLSNTPSCGDGVAHALHDHVDEEGFKLLGRGLQRFRRILASQTASAIRGSLASIASELFSVVGMA
jgi:hypothetical protein